METGTVGHRARDIAARVRSGEWSPVTVVGEHLDRAAALDGRVGAFRVLRAAAATAEATELAARADLADLPLAGVPVTIKDNVDVAGETTRRGSLATSDVPAGRDDELVRRLRAAGCVVIGKTNLPELAIWGFTESRGYGVTRNPHDLDRNAGGSTGGGAAAVAAGFAPLALGSDGGGSIRIPSSYCGIVGLKPGRGVVPMAGGGVEHWYGLSVYGPMAADAADAALMFDVLAGRAGDEPVAAARIAVSTRSPSAIVRPDTHALAGVARARRRLADAGHVVTDTDPPYPANLPLIFSSLWVAGIAEDAAELPADRLEPRTRTAARLGRPALRRGGPRRRWARTWEATALGFFAGGVDVLVTPVVAAPAPRAGAMAGRGFTRTLVASARTVPYTPAWNVAGLPAVSVPLGLHEGRPLSTQLVGPPGAEGTLLRLAAAIEEPHRPNL